MRFLNLFLFFAALTFGHVRAACPTNVGDNVESRSYFDDANAPTNAQTATKVLITCANGYAFLSGSPRSQTFDCVNGTQSIFPACTIKNCGPIPTVANATTELLSSGTEFGSSYRLTCLKGNVLFYDGEPDGANYRIQDYICEDGGWQRHGNCSFVDCGPYVKTVNATFMVDPSLPTAFGSSVTATCVRGTYATKNSYYGSQTAFCDAFGSWTAEFVGACSPFSQGQNCSDFSQYSVQNGRIELAIPSFTPAYPGDYANVTCNPGFYAVNNDGRMKESATWRTIQFLCDSDFDWQGLEYAECRPVDCGVRRMNGGNFTLNQENNSSYGATATISCEKGYVLGSYSAPKRRSRFSESAVSTTATLTCGENSEWSPNLYCNVNYCASMFLQKSVADRYNVTLDKPNEESGVNSTATISCLAGFYPTLDDRSRSVHSALRSGMKLMAGGSSSLSFPCSQNGWPTMTCSAVTCPAPSITNGAVSIGSNVISDFSDTTLLTCDNGFFVKGSSPRVRTATLTCGQSGAFTSASCSFNSTKTTDVAQVVTLGVVLSSNPSDATVLSIVSTLKNLLNQTNFRDRVTVGSSRVESKTYASVNSTSISLSPLDTTKYTVLVDITISAVSSGDATDPSSADAIVASVKTAAESTTSALYTSLSSVPGFTGLTSTVSDKPDTGATSGAASLAFVWNMVIAMIAIVFYSM